METMINEIARVYEINTDELVKLVAKTENDKQNGRYLKALRERIEKELEEMYDIYVEIGYDTVKVQQEICDGVQIMSPAEFLNDIVFRLQEIEGRE
jgi:hypothetical protein